MLIATILYLKICYMSEPVPGSVHIRSHSFIKETLLTLMPALFSRWNNRCMGRELAQAHKWIQTRVSDLVVLYLFRITNSSRMWGSTKLGSKARGWVVRIKTTLLALEWSTLSQTPETTGLGQLSGSSSTRSRCLLNQCQDPAKVQHTLASDPGLCGCGAWP